MHRHLLPWLEPIPLAWNRLFIFVPRFRRRTGSTSPENALKQADAKRASVRVFLRWCADKMLHHEAVEEQHREAHSSVRWTRPRAPPLTATVRDRLGKGARSRNAASQDR